MPGSGTLSGPRQLAVSPTTKISLRPTTRRSGATLTRPAASQEAPSQAPAGDAATPAAQIAVKVGMVSQAVSTRS